MLLNFRQKVDFQKNDSIMLYRGKDQYGEFIAYIRCKKDQYIKLMTDTEAGKSGELRSYGEVIYMDNIPEPDDKAKEFLKQYIAENS